MLARLRHALAVTTAVATAAASLTLLATSSAQGAETKTFTGEKSCGAPIVTISPPKPGGYCLITESSYKILFGARVYYTAAVVANGVLTSPVTLVATDERESTANGQCIFNLATPTTPAHGLCTYSGGTGKLAGFHAIVIVEPPANPAVRVYPLAGTYWFDRDAEVD